MSARFLERKPLVLYIVQCTIEEAGPCDYLETLAEGYNVPGYRIAENADWENAEYRERMAKELADHIREVGYDTLFMIAHKGNTFVERELHLLQVLLEELGDDIQESFDVMVLTQDWSKYRPSRQVRVFLFKEWCKNLFKRVFRRGELKYARVRQMKLRALRPWIQSMIRKANNQSCCLFGSTARNL